MYSILQGQRKKAVAVEGVAIDSAKSLVCEVALGFSKLEVLLDTFLTSILLFGYICLVVAIHCVNKIAVVAKLTFTIDKR